MPRVSCSSAAAAASNSRLRSGFHFAAARFLSTRFRCGKAVVAAAASSSSRLGSASSLITLMVCTSSWWQLLLWCLGSSDSSSLFSRFFWVVGSREGFVVSLLLLLLRMSCARLQDGPENVEIQCQLPPRFDAYYYVHLHVQGCELSVFVTGFWSCEF